MSKFDSGKHIVGNASDYKDFNDAPRGTVRPDGAIVSEKRLDPQRTTRTTARRQADYDANRLGNGAFHRPGTQNKGK